MKTFFLLDTFLYQIYDFKSFLGSKIQDGRQNPRWRTKIFDSFDQKVRYGPKELPCQKWCLVPLRNWSRLFWPFQTLLYIMCDIEIHNVLKNGPKELQYQKWCLVPLRNWSILFRLYYIDYLTAVFFFQNFILINNKKIQNPQIKALCSRVWKGLTSYGAAPSTIFGMGVLWDHI